MDALTALSRLIDAANARIGRLACWLVLAAVLVSAGNAVMRKAFDLSSNAWLELQWYMFAAIFLLSGGHTLLKQEHVRIDVIYSRFSRRTQIWIDLFGTLFFLLPMALLMLWLSWPFFAEALHSGERSVNAGGLILWPVKALMPLGFALLALQGISEFIKRLAFLRGEGPDPAPGSERMAELELADVLRVHGEGKS
ncbi:MAG: TRAP transporter small permease subunit [Rhodocyclaceae bacterium]|nr:TRAP transporter small permease subunit [Rhodocyclaceae bacterium]